MILSLSFRRRRRPGGSVLDVERGSARRLAIGAERDALAPGFRLLPQRVAARLQRFAARIAVSYTHLDVYKRQGWP